MKLFTLLCALITFSLSAMQEGQATLLQLDQKGLAEFKQAKKDIAEKGFQNLGNPTTNALLQLYVKLGNATHEELSQTFSQTALQSKIQELHRVSTKTEYLQALEDAKKSNNNEDIWKKFRYLNGKLLKDALREREVGITFPDPEVHTTITWLKANANLNGQACDYITAQSFLIYYARQIQRNITGQDLPALTFK